MVCAKRIYTSLDNRVSKMVVSVNSPAENVIPLESVFNLRKVDAKGRLFRSARQDKATPEDIQKLSGNLGIRTFFDLRSSSEYMYRSAVGAKSRPIDSEVQVVIPTLPCPKTRPYPSSRGSVPLKDLSGAPVSIASQETPRRYLINMCTRKVYWELMNMVPLYKRVLSLFFLIFDLIFKTDFKYFMRFYADVVNRHGVYGMYVSLLTNGAKEFCFILKTLSNPENLPALLSCAQGKDRTGIATALILSILGKSDDYITDDYALSEEGLKPIQHLLHREIVLKYNLDESFALARKETMQIVLDTLRERYGSVENYLESIGFNNEDQNKLREVLS